MSITATIKTEVHQTDDGTTTVAVAYIEGTAADTRVEVRVTHTVAEAIGKASHLCWEKYRVAWGFPAREQNEGFYNSQGVVNL